MGITIDQGRQLFALNTNTTTYAFAVDENGLLRHLYWGQNIPHQDLDIPVLGEISSNDPILDIVQEEFPVFGGMRYKEQCLKVSFADGARDIVYRYKNYETKENELIIHLADAHYPLAMEIAYKIYPSEDLIERSVTIANTGEDNIQVEEIYSGQLHIPHQNLTLTGSHGHWLAELQEFKQPLSMGKTILESRRGISTHNHNPFFILDHRATETCGDVYFGALKWSGNFKTVIEPRPYGTTLIQMGLNPYDTQLTLKAGETFTTPGMIIGYSSQGFGRMSHQMHRYARRHILKGGDRPVLYNSWEAMVFDVTCHGQIQLAKKAAAMGCELFVVDDGWFGNRNSDADGLGDWYINQEKFPQGLKPLIDEVKELGMQFGIWIEPEMVNPPADLLKNQPDWIYKFEHRENDTSRNQMVLNVTLPEVQDFIYHMIDDLLAKHDIDYIKWDANRPISQTGPSREIWIKHTQAVYDIVSRVKVKYPQVLIEACASGGGRVDYGSLSHFDDFWTSDNTDPFDRLTIQKTYSYLYPIKAMRAWVTDHPYRQVPLSFKFHSAMMGTLGMGCNILKFDEAQMEASKAYIAAYKKIRPTIQNGDFYRLEHQSSNGYHCFEYTYQDQALLFIFLPQANMYRANVQVKLQGLDPEAEYTFSIPKAMTSRYGDYLFTAADQNEVVTATKSGAYLMGHGIQLQLNGDYASALIEFNKGGR